MPAATTDVSSAAAIKAVRAFGAPGSLYQQIHRLSASGAWTPLHKIVELAS
jgi:hypothetical protein